MDHLILKVYSSLVNVRGKTLNTSSLLSNFFPRSTEQMKKSQSPVHGDIPIRIFFCKWKCAGYLWSDQKYPAKHKGRKYKSRTEVNCQYFYKISNKISFVGICGFFTKWLILGKFMFSWVGATDPGAWGGKDGSAKEQRHLTDDEAPGIIII